jgi:hypothetical protein
LLTLPACADAGVHLALLFFFFMFGALELYPGSQGLLQLTSISMLFSPHLLLRLDTASALAWFKAVAISGVLDYLLF